MDRADVMRWVAEYEAGWRDGDTGAVARLSTPDAEYRVSPYEPPKVGHGEIADYWLDDEGEVFTVSAEPVAVEGSDAVVRVEVRYGDPLRQEYRDLWVLRFAEDGRVARSRSGRTGRASRTPTPIRRCELPLGHDV